MKYVLDASVAVKWVLPEPDSIQALRLWDDFQAFATDLLAPDTFPVEIAHALTRAERRGLLSVGEAGIKLADILTAGVDLRLSALLLPRAVELSSQYRIGVYDCLYVALAEQESCGLVTADLRLVSTMHGVVPMVPLSTL